METHEFALWKTMDAALAANCETREAIARAWFDSEARAPAARERLKQVPDDAPPALVALRDAVLALLQPPPE